MSQDETTRDWQRFFPEELGVRLRLGPGPVFFYEWLSTTRRWQLYALRAGFVWVILVGMGFIWQEAGASGPTVSIQQAAAFGASWYKTTVSIELTLVLLAAPAATAGAICLDKARGTLDHMLATDLTSAEIVLGKLGVRLVPVLGLVACVLPILALAGLLGGIDPNALLGSFLTALGCAVLGCALAATLSVWGRKTHEVLMLTYILIILWLISPLLLVIAIACLSGPSVNPSAAFPTLWEWIECANPYYLAFAPYSDPGKVGWTTCLGFLGACLVGSAVLIGLASLRVRGVALRQAGRAAPARRLHPSRLLPRLARPAWLPRIPGPSLDGNPILWREWHRTRPSRMMRAVWLVYAVLGVFWTVLVLAALRPPYNQREEAAVFMNMFQVAVGLLLLSVSASTSLAEERARGSLDVVLSTPLATRSILSGKWWGTFRQVIRIVIWPAVVGGLLAANGGHWSVCPLLVGLVLANAAWITSLGLALAIWVTRLGRAVALCVGTYVVIIVGWPLLIVVLLGETHGFAIPLVMGDPLYGVMLTTIAVSSDAARMPGELTVKETVALAFLWILVHAAIAASLFTATLFTFDHCLGRIPETSGFVLRKPKRNPVVEFELDH